MRSNSLQCILIDLHVSCSLIGMSTVILKSLLSRLSIATIIAIQHHYYQQNLNLRAQYFLAHKHILSLHSFTLTDLLALCSFVFFLVSFFLSLYLSLSFFLSLIRLVRNIVRSRTWRCTPGRIGDPGPGGTRHLD